MAKLIVKIPFNGKSLRSFKNKAEEATKTVSSKKRVRKYRENLKNDPSKKEKLEKMKEIKQQENNAYILNMKLLREKNESLNKAVKEKNRLRMQKLRKRNADKIRRQSSNNELTKQTETQRHFVSSTKVRKVDSSRKQVERASKALPQKSESWAHVVTRIIEKATPKRKSMLKFETDDQDAVGNVVGARKVGRPRKEIATVKRKLAFSGNVSAWKSPKVHAQYKARKLVQLKHISKRNVHRETWKKDLDAFLEDNSRKMPNKKDTIKINNQEVAKRHLLSSKVELYKKFKNKFPNFDRNVGTFLKMIPKNYRNLNLTCRRVCVCTKEYNIDQKIEALNRMAKQKSHPELKASNQLLSNITMCTFEKLPNRSCVDRTCTSCGTLAIQKLYKPLTEVYQREILTYHQWETRPESYTNKDGKRIVSNRWIQVQRKTNVEDLVTDIAHDMETFTGHLFRTNYQHMMQRGIMSNIPMDQCAVVMDFSENMSMQAQDEIESAHWTTKQVTLHPIHIERHAENSTAENPVIMKESLIILSDCLAHNSGAVYAFTKQLLLHISNNPGPCAIKTIHRFTDNCATQYKCKDAFSHIKLIEDAFDVKVIYHYTESGHGKGPSDGLGAAIKKRLERLILGGKVVNNAYQAYLALVHTQTNKINQKIIYLPQAKLTREMPPKDLTVKTVKGTQSFHMVKLHTHTRLLECSDLSCSCMVCMTSAQEGPCYFRQYRQAPQVHKLFHENGNKTSDCGGILCSLCKIM